MNNQNGIALFTDLDGTLLQSDRKASERSLRTLEELGRRGIWRAVVTGRSFFSAKTVLPDSFPIDFLVTSSGAGVFDFRDLTLVGSHALPEAAVRRVMEYLISERFDFMVHAPVPDNHTFEYLEHGAHNPDFLRRCQFNAQFCQELDPEHPRYKDASQFLVVCPEVADPVGTHQKLSQALSDLTVIRTTSPSDHRSTWFEIFPAHVSKAQASTWLCGHLGVDSERSLAVGNDYNDADLLEWCGFSFVVGNAPDPLKEQFSVVSDHNSDGFSEAIEQWLGSVASGVGDGG